MVWLAHDDGDPGCSTQLMIWPTLIETSCRRWTSLQPCWTAAPSPGPERFLNSFPGGWPAPWPLRGPIVDMQLVLGAGRSASRNACDTMWTRSTSGQRWIATTAIIPRSGSRARSTGRGVSHEEAERTAPLSFANRSSGFLAQFAQPSWMCRVCPSLSAQAGGSIGWTSIHGLCGSGLKRHALPWTRGFTGVGPLQE